MGLMDRLPELAEKAHEDYRQKNYILLMNALYSVERFHNVPQYRTFAGATLKQIRERQKQNGDEIVDFMIPSSDIFALAQLNNLAGHFAIFVADQATSLYLVRPPMYLYKKTTLSPDWKQTDFIQKGILASNNHAPAYMRSELDLAMISIGDWLRSGLY